MRKTLETPQFAVFDDVLPADQLAEVRRFIDRDRYKSVHHDQWNKVWRLTDGNPLQGTTFLSRANPDATDDEPAAVPVYPTGLGVDRIFELIHAHRDAFTSLVGRLDSEWRGFTARTFLYPAGTGLGWHSDAGNPYVGAYIFYGHAQWSSHWGGELLVAFPRPEGDEPPRAPGADRLLTHGVGHYIAPTPNRLVVVGRDQLHRINPVLAAAGDHVRSTISGFFLR